MTFARLLKPCTEGLPVLFCAAVHYLVHQVLVRPSQQVVTGLQLKLRRPQMIPGIAQRASCEYVMGP